MAGVKTIGADGREIHTGDVVENVFSNSEEKHIVINHTTHLIMFKASNGHIVYHPARKYKKVEAVIRTQVFEERF